MFAQLRSSYDSGLAQFRASYADSGAGGALVVVTDIDGGNCDPAKTVITDASGASPVVYCDVRDHAQLTDWRQFLFAVEGVEGKTPVFRFNWASRYFNLTPPTTWRPMWTQDFVTWTRAEARTLNGTSSAGTIEWQFTDPLPAGRVYIASHATGRQAEGVALAAELLADYPAVASPTASANASGVFATSPAEIDDLGRQIGGHPMHAFKLAWPGLATTDGGPKRKLVQFANIHAAGEALSWIAFRAALDWLLNDPGAQAQAVRANWDVYLYFSLSPNALYAGSRRWNISASRNTDTNRVWALDSAAITLEEIRNTAIAVVNDTGGVADVLYSWHGMHGSNKFFNLFVVPEELDAPRPAPIQAVLDAGYTFFGNQYPDMQTSGTYNTDCWWGKAKLGAKVSIDNEFPHNTSNDPALYRDAGVKWMRILQTVDAQQIFYAPPAGEAFGALSSVALAAPTATASGTTVNPSATASGALPIIVLSAPAGIATATDAGDVAASGAFATLSITAPVGSASGTAMADANASGEFDAIVIIAPSANATGTSPSATTAPPTAAEMLAAYQAAEIALLKGKETSIGDRRLRREDLSEIRAGRIEWERRVANAAASVARVPRFGGLAFKVVDLSGLK